MTKFYKPIYLIIAFLFTCNLFAQIDRQFNNELNKFKDNTIAPKNNYLLDGVFIKETSLTRNISYNSISRPYYGNQSFRKFKSYPRSFLFNPNQLRSKTNTAVLSDTILNLIQSKPKVDKTIDDCIYIEPIKDYCLNYQEINNKPLFILDKNEKPILGHYLFPNSIRFYIDTQYLSLGKNQIELTLDSNFQLNKVDFLEPFYFRKFEVTNKEYKEFVNWVRDSIYRTALFESGFTEFGHYKYLENNDSILVINWNSKIDFNNKELVNELEYFFKPNYERFYTQREIDTRRLNYNFNYQNQTSINIYPDTLVWVTDFNYSFNEPLTNTYFWHPAYSNYPVVGINFWQAKAFLNWKTKQHQNKLDESGVHLIVKYNLPNDFQWDIVATAELDENKNISLFTNHYEYISDYNWITDLILNKNQKEIIDSVDKSGKKFVSSKYDYLHRYLLGNEKFFGNLVLDGSLTTTICDLSQLKKRDRKNPFVAINLDKTNVSHLGSNVSEWIDNDYKTQWKPVFNMRQMQLQSNNGDDSKIISSIERYYDLNNDSLGKLIRGGNWYDQRFSNLFDKNVKGTNAKVFAHPDSSYSTVGFRYIIQFQFKETEAD
ncbi:MAG: hypothetical protein DWP98_05910 [Bacteroidetes bacterium]|nr:MAG: hypothetical protein DWP98_05910 [Bacteroidota bacterium]MBL1145721.1 hypothetical protein [Bacteroidota bacterium]NOG58515.1 SUMF1/EgtB/PvdO family nonheme iron enzyme [Bacteroidota bacterium]